MYYNLWICDINCIWQLYEFIIIKDQLVYDCYTFTKKHHMDYKFNKWSCVQFCWTSKTNYVQFE